MLSCSNAAIRKDVLIKHPFAKELGKNGGEDLEVAYRILKDDMVVAFNPKLLVKHSHGKNLKGFIKELKTWKKIYGEVLDYIKCKG
jgi:rhamnosyltransferase